MVIGPLVRVKYYLTHALLNSERSQSFCLTNGTSWIFGLVVSLQPASTSTEYQSGLKPEPDYRVYLSPSIGPIHSGGALETRTAHNNNLHCLVEALLIWVS